MLTSRPWLTQLLLSPLGLLIPIAPRSGPLIVLLLGVAGGIHYLRHRPSLDWLRSKSVSVLCILLAFLFMTGFWSHVPERSFEQAFRLILLMVFGLAGVSLIRALDDSQKQRLTRCLIPALIVGIVTGCIYGLLQYTGPYIRVLTDFLGASPEFSNFKSADNRLHIAKTMLITNLAFFALLPWLWRVQKIAALLAYAALLAVCTNSDSQSALIAALAGGGIFAATQLSKAFGARLILAGIITSFVLVLPITQFTVMEKITQEIKSTSIGKATSPDMRLRVYGLFGALALKKPALGHGLMSGVKYETKGKQFDYRFVPLSARTPHNFHLQIIFDTGFIGAGLLLLALLWPIWHLLKTGQTQTALSILLPLSVMMSGTLFNFVIWRTWIPGATILSIFFLYLSAAKTDYQT